ncbi:MAG: alkaline phosphatase D family protein, partial [Pseudomonadales bacterium]|nr:alkaline phosphatase D family protein [Pseudomonadales bacterium]
MGPYAVAVRWEVATDPGMRHLVRRDEVAALPEFAHSIHVDLQGLQAGRDYWYRFQTGRYRTEIGHTKTLADGPDLTARFVTTSCQNYTHGYFLAYEHMVNDQPDFVIHLGDYIYDTSFGETFRRHDSEQPPKTLIDYRRRHALYKTDLHLQRAHAALPFYCVIDNHDAIEDNDPAKYEQRAAAYRAWYEHMPVRGFSLRKANVFDMHRLLRLGDLMQISLLDTRQFRDLREKCTENLEHALGFGNYRERCAALFRADRTLLGAEQEHWLYQSLKNNTSVWNVIASSGPVMPFRLDMGDEEYGYIGAWDAYPSNRRRLVSVLENAPLGQPIILSGDMHS